VSMGWTVINGIKATTQLEMGEHVKAHKGCQRGCWVLRGDDCDVPHCLGAEKMMYLHGLL
jgi:hypothetical protein